MKKTITLLLLAVIFSMSVKAAADTTALSLQVGAGSKYGYLNVIDLVTGSGIATTVTNIVVQNNNPELATITASPSISPTAIAATAIAPGNGTATVTCHLQYTDPGDGLQKSEDKSTIVSYTVIGSPHGVKLTLSFN